VAFCGFAIFHSLVTRWRFRVFQTRNIFMRRRKVFEHKFPKIVEKLLFFAIMAGHRIFVFAKNFKI
jgi:hypothetical protein